MKLQTLILIKTRKTKSLRQFWKKIPPRHQQKLWGWKNDVWRVLSALLCSINPKIKETNIFASLKTRWKSLKNNCSLFLRKISAKTPSKKESNIFSSFQVSLLLLPHPSDSIGRSPMPSDPQKQQCSTTCFLKRTFSNSATAFWPSNVFVKSEFSDVVKDNLVCLHLQKYQRSSKKSNHLGAKVFQLCGRLTEIVCFYDPTAHFQPNWRRKTVKVSELIAIQKIDLASILSSLAPKVCICYLCFSNILLCFENFR